MNKCNVRKEVVSKSTPETACRKVNERERDEMILVEVSRISSHRFRRRSALLRGAGSCRAWRSASTRSRPSSRRSQRRRATSSPKRWVRSFTYFPTEKRPRVYFLGTLLVRKSYVDGPNGP